MPPKPKPTTPTTTGNQAMSKPHPHYYVGTRRLTSGLLPEFPVRNPKGEAVCRAYNKADAEKIAKGLNALDVVSEYIAARDEYEAAIRPASSWAQPVKLAHDDHRLLRWRYARECLSLLMIGPPPIEDATNA